MYDVISVCISPSSLSPAGDNQPEWGSYYGYGDALYLCFFGYVQIVEKSNWFPKSHLKHGDAACYLQEIRLGFVSRQQWPAGMVCCMLVNLTNTKVWEIWIHHPPLPTFMCSWGASSLFESDCLQTVLCVASQSNEHLSLWIWCHCVSRCGWLSSEWDLLKLHSCVFLLSRTKINLDSIWTCQNKNGFGLAVWT